MEKAEGQEAGREWGKGFGLHPKGSEETKEDLDPRCDISTLDCSLIHTAPGLHGSPSPVPCSAHMLVHSLLHACSIQAEHPSRAKYPTGMNARPLTLRSSQPDCRDIHKEPYVILQSDVDRV